MSHMKKVSAREFQHHFGRVTAALKPGQAVQVTKAGKVHGIYQRVGNPRVQRPNFLEATERHNYSERVGAELLKRLDEALS